MQFAVLENIKNKTVQVLLYFSDVVGEGNDLIKSISPKSNLQAYLVSKKKRRQICKNWIQKRIAKSPQDIGHFSSGYGYTNNKGYFYRIQFITASYYKVIQSRHLKTYTFVYRRFPIVYF
jgi:hypothetical protein